ncbi:MAG: hypothetical protein WBA13_00570 [Microcoleaceae cyanobacterium]
MTCPRNSLGQPACFITAHPARPQHKFCITCHQYFPAPSRTKATQTSPNLLYWAIAILTVLIMTKAMQIQSIPASPPAYRFETLQ